MCNNRILKYNNIKYITINKNTINTKNRNEVIIMKKGTKGRVIYSIGEYKVLRMYCYKTKVTSYIVRNTKTSFKHGHTHVKTKELGIILAKNIYYKRYPKSNNLEYLKSHLRVSIDFEYNKELLEKIQLLGGL